MTSRNARYRARRIAEGAKPIWLLLSAEAAVELDSRCVDAGVSRVQLIERWLLSPRSDDLKKDP